MGINDKNEDTHVCPKNEPMKQSPNKEMGKDKTAR